LAGRLVLDVGSGTGAVAEAAAAKGARVVAADRSVGMVAYDRGRNWPAVAADVLALPFGQGIFDAVLAGFMLNHLPPARAITAMARTVRPGGVVLASTWAARPDPVKAGIDAVVASWGWVPPDWYLTMKTEVLPISGDPTRLAAAAGQSGLVEIRASVEQQDLGVRDPRTVVAYRLAMPHIAPWWITLDGRARAEITRQALAAVAEEVEGWRPAFIVFSGRVAGQSNRAAAARSKASA
jgi:SAM-dependent methyltransferase